MAHSNDTPETDLDRQLAECLKEHGVANCPTCGRKIDRGDIAWNAPSTEAGTPYAIVEIQCQQCETEIVHIQSWYPLGWSDKDEQFEAVVTKILRRDW